jgi:hypothetical protein
MIDPTAGDMYARHFDIGDFLPVDAKKDLDIFAAIFAATWPDLK